jgi:TolB protein
MAAVAIAAVAVAFATAAVAAERPTIVVTQGKDQSYRVALQRFAGGPGAEAFHAALGDALEYSGIFRMIDPAAFLGPTTTSSLDADSHVNCSEWVTIGGDVFVEGALRVEGVALVAEFRVWDLASCQRKLRQPYRQIATADPGILARQMADDIVKAFTGVRGVSSTELSFVSTRSGNSEIFVMDANGQNQRAATANRSINNFPDWSSSGESIVYTTYRHENRPSLYVSTRGRGKPGRILSNLGDFPQYSAVFGPDGGELALVMSPEESTEIYRVRTNGKGLRQLTHNRHADVSPAWSPDGRQLAFVSDRSGSPQVYLMNGDGSGARRLTFNGGYNTDPAWSPDGRWIAYQSRVGGNQFDIWLIDPEGSVNLPLISHIRSDESPSWSPDSRKIAFSSTRRGRADIYVVDANGANLRRLTQGAGENTSPAWGPHPR